MNNSLQHVDIECLSYMGLLPKLGNIYFTIAFILCGFLGTCTNVFLFYLFIRWRFLRRGGNKLFLSMCIADLLVTSFFSVTKVLQMQHSEICVISKLGRYAGCVLIISDACIAAIAFTYYRRLRKFRKYRSIFRDDEPSYVWIIMACWLSPLVVAIATVWPDWGWLVISFILFVLYYFIFAYCYNMVIQQLMEQYKAAKRLGVAQQERIDVGTKFKKAAQLIGLLMLSSLLFSLPMLLFHVSICILEASNQFLMQRHTTVIAAVAQLCYILKSSLTPLICIHKHLDIKLACKKTLTRRRRKNVVAPYVTA